MSKEGSMGRKERIKPISSFEDYMRRYLPGDEKQRKLSSVSQDPKEAAVERGRQAVDRAVAQLTSAGRQRASEG